MKRPPKVHEKDGSWYYVHKNKWHRLCRVSEGESALYQALADLKKPEAPKTVDALLDAYIAEKLPELAFTTQGEYLRVIDKRLRHHFGHQALADVQLPHVAAYLEFRRKQGHGASGNKEASILSSAFDYGLRQMWVQSNPCRGVRRNKEKPRRRYVRDQELSAALLSAPEPFADVMRFALLTGLRQGDIRRLKRSAVSKDGISVDEGKTGAGIDIKWSDELREVVDRALERSDCEYVFTSTRNPKRPWGKWAIQSAMKRLGVDWNFHDLRAKAESDHPKGLGLLTRYDRRKVVRPFQ